MYDRLKVDADNSCPDAIIKHATRKTDIGSMIFMKETHKMNMTQIMQMRRQARKELDILNISYSKITNTMTMSS